MHCSGSADPRAGGIFVPVSVASPPPRPNGMTGGSAPTGSCSAPDRLPTAAPEQPRSHIMLFSVQPKQPEEEL